ncbi:MAG: LLM class F420-dependent oxidoreductase [Dermatophilaceae bacterium]
MKLGLGLGYGGEPVEEFLPSVELADRIGYDSVWSLEEYGPDAVSVLGYLAARTENLKLGTGILQIAPRTPALTAMTMTTLDVLSGGRMILGLGLSVPWVIEGWHGLPYGKPLTVIREYVDVVRAAVAREAPLSYDGSHYQIPYRGPDARCEPRPIKSLFPPVRSSIPVYLGTMGPRSVRLTGEIADGWLPGLYSPEREAVALAPLDEGIARAGRQPSDVAIAHIVEVVRDDDVGAARDELRPLMTSYIGPKGVGLVNSFFALVCEMGWEAEAHAIRDHYLDGRRSEAGAAVPDSLIDEFALIGPLDRIVDRLAAWKESRVDTLILLTRDLEVIEAARNVV